ncbi:MAG TPA: hypothetical protein PKZ32_06050, partial [Candidatus Melainabacteria bacterium]|nr:hypothetical protein [Candidatus Melainabacteria bacterium]
MKKLKRKLVPFMLLSILSTYANSAIAQDDVVFKAMKDEMDRSVKQLKIKGHEAPYFISYTVKDKDVVRIAGSFGALDSRSSGRDR